MPWFGIVEKSTGRLFSIGSVLLDVDPEKYDVQEYPDRPDFSSSIWDENTKSFIARPKENLKDWIEEFVASSMLTKLNPSEKDTIKNFLISKVGEERFY